MKDDPARSGYATTEVPGNLRFTVGGHSFHHSAVEINGVMVDAKRVVALAAQPPQERAADARDAERSVPLSDESVKTIASYFGLTQEEVRAIADATIQATKPQGDAE